MNPAFLVIQTAFIGDVILATPLAERLKTTYPSARVDFLVRKGNENLLQNNPWIDEVLVWNKKNAKYKELLKILKRIRGKKYSEVINLQRFASTGFLTAFSGAKSTRGFKKNPFSFLFNSTFEHHLKPGTHEVDRNLSVLEGLCKTDRIRPSMFPSKSDLLSVEQYQGEDYSTISPTSVWFTKQYPADQWESLISELSHKVYLLGGPPDSEACEMIATKFPEKVENLAGKLSFLQSAALMAKAKMNYVNDSAPMHICSAMNAPVKAVYCSTIPDFGFGPLSDNSQIIETKINLDCRPCGLHGFKNCPKVHFKCAKTIKNEQFL